MDESIYLRERFTRETEHLIQQILSIYIQNQSDNLACIKIGLQLIRILAKRCPRWLAKNKNIVEKVFEIFNKFYYNQMDGSQSLSLK